jgi:alpha-mannosidase
VLGAHTSKLPGDVFLPDSAGFTFALPSIAVYSGLDFFSTQKLKPEGVIAS